VLPDSEITMSLKGKYPPLTHRAEPPVPPVACPCEIRGKSRNARLKR